MVLQSLRGLLWSLWLLLLCGFLPGRSFPSVSGFSSSCFGVPGCLPRVFFSSSVASLSSLSGSLALSGYPVCPLPRSFLLGIWRLWCRLRAVLLLSPIPVLQLSRSSCLCLSASSLSLSVSSRSFSFSFWASLRSYSRCLFFCFFVFLFGSFFLFCAFSVEAS